MKTFIAALSLSFLLSGAYAIAGAGHDHGHSHAQVPVSQEAAKLNASRIISTLIEADKIDESWVAVKAESVEKKMLNGSPEWVVTFLNENIADMDKQRLYVFLTEGGEYIAVNYTGN